MPQRRLVLAINPSASFGKASDAGPQAVELLRAAGHAVHPVVAPSYELLVERVRDALAEGADALVVVGGDGMVHLGAGLVGGTDTPLGLIPVGTGNDVALSAGIPRHDIAAAVGRLLDALDHGPVAIDTGIAAWTDEAGVLVERRFVGAVSCGFDAFVNERANRMRFPKGASRYQLALARELLALKPIEYRIEWDGGVIEQTGVLVAVANNRSIGGGIAITPNASMTDGWFDLFLVESLTRVEFLRIYPRVSSGTHLDDPRVTVLHTTHARVALRQAQGPAITAYADGERLGPLPIDVRLEPASLRFLGVLS